MACLRNLETGDYKKASSCYEQVQTIAFTPDATQLLCNDGKINIYTIPELELQNVLQHENGAVFRIFLPPNGKHVASEISYQFPKPTSLVKRSVPSYSIEYEYSLEQSKVFDFNADKLLGDSRERSGKIISHI